MDTKRTGLIPKLKVLVWIGALLPVSLLIYRLFLASGIVDDPVELIQHWTGTTALILLLTTLSVSPVRRLTGYRPLVRFRRLTGLFAFFYATLHAFSYFVFDHRMNLASISEDIIEHPWVLVGFSAFVLLIPLTVTSTSGWIRRLGGKRWRTLHRLIYPIAILGVLHFYWLVKADISEPILYAVILAFILTARTLIKS